jgi:hypothetical protein
MSEPRYCEAIEAQFVWGATRCGIPAPFEVYDDMGERRHVCTAHYEAIVTWERQDD